MGVSHLLFLLKAKEDEKNKIYLPIILAGLRAGANDQFVRQTV